MHFHQIQVTEIIVAVALVSWKNLALICRCLARLLIKHTPRVLQGCPQICAVHFNCNVASTGGRTPLVFDNGMLVIRIKFTY